LTASSLSALAAAEEFVEPINTARINRKPL